MNMVICVCVNAGVYALQLFHVRRFHKCNDIYDMIFQINVMLPNLVYLLIFSNALK